jgi:hypothetical protein
MPWSRADSRKRSLAEVQPDQLVRVEHILFDMLKDLCHGIGIVEGDVLRCRRSSRAVVLLETAAHRTVIMDGDWARFVQICVLDSAQPRLPVHSETADRRVCV